MPGVDVLFPGKSHSQIHVLNRQTLTPMHSLAKLLCETLTMLDAKPRYLAYILLDEVIRQPGQLWW